MSADSLTSALAPSGRWRIGSTCRCGISFLECWVGESHRGSQCCWRCEENERAAHDIRDGGDAGELSRLTDADRAHLRTLGWADPVELSRSAV